MSTAAAIRSAMWLESHNRSEPPACYALVRTSRYIGNSTQQARNGDIHRHVRSIRAHYDKRIHERLLELGCEDFSWDERNECSDHRLPNPEVEPHATLIADD